MKKHILGTYLIVALVAFALVGCFTPPDPLWEEIDPDEENAKTPVITSVDKTAMWTDEALTITGQNFSDSLEQNLVYFFTVNEPVVDDSLSAIDTLIVIDSTEADAVYEITTFFKDIDVEIKANDYVTTITQLIAGNTTTTEYRVPTSITEYTASDSTTLEITNIVTEPVFTLFDTTTYDSTIYDTTRLGIITSRDTTLIASIDTTGYTKMKKTVTTYSNITEWLCHTAELGTVTSASSTELVVTPPALDIVNAKIAIHVRNAIAPAEWGYIDVMVKP